MTIISDYFKLSDRQAEQFAQLDALYRDWNSKINVISRKDIDNLYEHHVLHSLAIAKWIPFQPDTTILDVGTGGGFPGIPLAIMFPQCRFVLVDSIGKKIKVASEVAKALGLTNVVVLVALVRMGHRDALVINILRILIVGFTFSNTFSMLYSLAGGMLSWFAMSLMHRSGRFGIVGISVSGGVCHNIGQIIAAAMLITVGSLLYYLPFLLLSGTVAGVMIGIISAAVVKRLPRGLFA